MHERVKGTNAEMHSMPADSIALRAFLHFVRSALLPFLHPRRGARAA
jgi:hypothetical protein